MLRSKWHLYSITSSAIYSKALVVEKIDRPQVDQRQQIVEQIGFGLVRAFVLHAVFSRLFPGPFAGVYERDL
jgi:hypothetical protein